MTYRIECKCGVRTSETLTIGYESPQTVGTLMCFRCGGRTTVKLVQSEKRKRKTKRSG